MAKIKLTLPGLEIPVNGKQVSFTAPCSCSAVDGIHIDGVDYDVVDSAGNVVPFGRFVWCEGAVLTVTLDVTNRKAYLQNQNAYTRYEAFTPATAELFGLSADAVPNDALSFLGKYAQHWWRRRSTSGYTISLGNSETIKTHDTTSGSAQVRYSDTVNIGENGSLSLNNPTTIVVNAGDATLVGKYFEAASNCSFPTGVIYFGVTAPAWDFSEGEDCKMTAQRVSAVLGNTSEWEIVRSSNRNEYPDSGILSGYEYEYICNPLENAAIVAPKIATGSYTGTGKYGASNPCKLTFGFKPVIVFLYPDQNCDISHHPSTANTDPYAIRFGVTTKFYDNSTAAYYNNLSYTGNTMSWYCTGGSGASTQLNYSGWKYYYVAIG